MRKRKSPNPQLMDYFKKEIEPLLQDELRRFMDTLREQKLSKTKFYLMGSFAEGTPHKRSDVDIGVVFEGEQPDLNVFYGLLGERGTLKRVKGARIELTLLSQDVLDLMRREGGSNIREIVTERANQSPERLG